MPWYADLFVALAVMAIEGIVIAGFMYTMAIEGWAFNADYGGQRDAPEPPDFTGRMEIVFGVVAAVAALAALGLGRARCFISATTQGLVAVALGLGVLGVNAYESRDGAFAAMTHAGCMGTSGGTDWWRGSDSACFVENSP